MNIKITSLTFLIAAVAGMSFSQAANAGNARFDYAPNEFPLEQPTGHHGGRYLNSPRNVVAPIAANSMPKSLLDKDFVSKPAPPPPAPVVAAAPIARPSTSIKASIPNLFNSVFNPVKSDPALVAAAPGQLPAFGLPNAQKLPTAPMPKMPNLAHNTNTAIRLLTPQHRHPVAALAAVPFKMPEVKHQGSGYTIGANIPLATSTGSSASTAVIGKLMRH